MNKLLLAPKADNVGGAAANRPIGQTTTPPAPNDPRNQPAEAPELTIEQQLENTKAELAAANAKLARAGIVGDIEADVIWRMRGGLSREQAIESSRRQALYDKAWTDSQNISDPVAAKVALDAGVKQALRAV